MTSGHDVTIQPTAARVEVRLGDTVLAESDRPVRLDETGYPPRWYLPREDVHLDLFRRTTFESTCPFKGQATYWSLDLDGETHDGIVWSYEDPIEAAKGIRGLLAFFPDRVDIVVDGDPAA